MPDNDKVGPADWPKCPQCGIDRPAPPHGRYCACGHDWKPKNYCAPSLSPTYFRLANGGMHRPAAGIEREAAIHSTKVHEVYTEARKRFPEAADVIAAMAYEIDSYRRRSQKD